MVDYWENVAKTNDILIKFWNNIHFKYVKIEEIQTDWLISFIDNWYITTIPPVYEVSNLISI